MDKNVLIYGFGKIGNIYAKYLTKHNICWSWYDIKIPSKLPIFNDFTHIIISTPETEHFNCFNELKHSSAKILVEKPVALTLNNLEEMDNSNVFYAMVERFNPITHAIADRVEFDNLIGVNFFRWVKGNIKHSVIMDIGIHDLDLCFYIFKKNFEIKSVNKFKKNTLISLSDEEKFYNFNWSKNNFYEQRTIFVQEKNRILFGDFKNQSLTILEEDKKIEVPIVKNEPLEQELLFFLNGNSLNAKNSHILSIALESC